jgi:hypothetical protein
MTKTKRTLGLKIFAVGAITGSLTLAAVFATLAAQHGILALGGVLGIELIIEGLLIGGIVDWLRGD